MLKRTWKIVLGIYMENCIFFQWLEEEGTTLALNNSAIDLDIFQKEKCIDHWTEIKQNSHNTLQSRKSPPGELITNRLYGKCTLCLADF